MGSCVKTILDYSSTLDSFRCASVSWIHIGESLTIQVFEIFSNIICLKLFSIGSAYFGHDFGLTWAYIASPGASNGQIIGIFLIKTGWAPSDRIMCGIDSIEECLKGQQLEP